MSVRQISAVRAGWILTQRELTHWVAQPAAPLFNLAFLIMLLLMFVYIFGAGVVLPDDARDAGIDVVGTMMWAYLVPFHITHGPPVLGSVGSASPRQHVWPSGRTSTSRFS